MALADLDTPPKLMDVFLEKEDTIQENMVDFPNKFYVLDMGNHNFAAIPHEVQFLTGDRIFRQKVALLSCFETEEDCKGYANNVSLQGKALCINLSEAEDIVIKSSNLFGLALHENATSKVKKVYMVKESV